MSGSWYKSVNTSSLEQGDLFRQFPVIISTLDGNDIISIAKGEKLELPAKIAVENVIVLTQSCDLENAKVDNVILCPTWPINEKKLNWSKDQKESARRGFNFAYHLIHGDDSLGLPIQAVEFRRLFVTPRAALIEFAASIGNRPRLVSPYKEHLAQAFARYFMRVGLPSGIPSF